MPRRPKKPLPKVSRNYREIIADELLAFWASLVSNWMFILPSILVIVVLVHLVRPMPPATVRIATGQPNSTSEVIGQQFREAFAKHHVKLELIPSSGAQENIKLIESGQVDAAFSQGGVDLGEHGGVLRSLGSIAYQPLWLFYRGPEVKQQDLNHFLKDRTVSLNIPGSGSRVLAEQILQAHEINIDTPRFVTMNASESLKALHKGEIDAMFVVAGMESRNVLDLLESPGIHVFDFNMADAYARRFKYLDAIVLPRGALDLSPVSPSTNINLLATTVDILATDQLHPAIQLLFLDAARNFDEKRATFFSMDGKFPTYMDTRIPESEVARRFFKEGTPFLWGYAPYWIASLFDEIWFYLLAFGAIAIPALSFLPNYRKTHAELTLEECYSALRAIEIEMAQARTVKNYDYQGLLHRLDTLKLRVRSLWIPTGNRQFYYDLRAAVNIVRDDLLADMKRPD